MPILTAIGGALIGGGMELGGQLLSGKSLNEVDWADVGIETVKGGLIGSGNRSRGSCITGRRGCHWKSYFRYSG